MSNETSLPGVMIYADKKHVLEELRPSDVGKLVLALLNYAVDGTEPDFTGQLKLVWLGMQPRIDNDRVRYESSRSQHRYASYCREVKRDDLVPLCYEDWLRREEQLKKYDSVIEKYRAVSADI